MATMIKVQCPSCEKQLQMAASAFHLTVFDAGNGHYYEFFCPKCHEGIRKPADTDVQELLTKGGVSSSYLHVPREVFEKREGAPLTKDDLLDFARALAKCKDVALQALSSVDI